MNNPAGTAATETARAVVLGHLEAFNQHNSARLLAGFTADASWTTGQYFVTGRDGIADLFDAWLWQLQPSLTVMTVIAQHDAVAVELIEELVVDGGPHRYSIAAFFRLKGGLISAAKVYREGMATIE